MAPYGYERWLASLATKDPIEPVPRKSGIRREGHGYVLRAATDGTAEIVREVFRRAEGGESLKVIADSLTARGVATPAARFLGARRAWSRSGLHNILRNPIYVGALIWGTSRPGTPAPVADADLGECRSPISASSFIKNPLVTKEQWDAVQQTLDGVRETTRGRRKSQPAFFLSGLLRCAQCDAYLNGHTSSKKARRRRRYYKHARNTAAERACPTIATYIPATPLERAVETALRDWVTDSTLWTASGGPGAASEGRRRCQTC